MSDNDVRDKMFEARDLIQAKRYPQARALLVSIDHPKATEWLRKLDDVEARERSMGTQVVHQRQTTAETLETRNPYAHQQNAYPQQQANPYAQQQNAYSQHQNAYTQPEVYPQQYAQQPVYDPIRDAAVSSYERDVPERKRINALHIIGALIGGLVGAALGAVIWAAVAYFIDYELGYIALAVGFLSGLFAVLFSGGRRGIPIQLIAILTALIGIFVGKYAAVYTIGIKAMNEQAGRDVTRTVLENLPPLAPDTVSLVVQDIVAALQPIDALFVVLAVVAAISIAAASRKPRQPKLQAA